jgi:DNA primase
MSAEDITEQYPDRWQRHNHVALCLDNDAAGIAAAARLTEILKQAGYDNVSRLFPECKDWNEQLVASFCDEPEEELVMSM